MSDIAVRVENLGKEYRLGQLQLKNQTIGDVVSRTVSRFRGTQTPPDPRPNRQNSQDELMWALKDISFEVKKGEALGIIGHNGAGKSTLLKILARITEPTEGFADIYGRIGALLEVGTGFHLELTGRENVFLNGAILGMQRSEIMRKFDEIVEFSGVEKFMDTPVKRYSSGMRLRLGFAVAAYLEPEILVVDEVLAVGDAAFQQKCLGKMQDVAQEGRTVLFVSHNLDAIISLTERAILLNQGRIAEIGPSQTVVMNYLRSVDRTEATHGVMAFQPSEASPDADIVWMQTANDQGELSSVFPEGEPITITIGLRIHRPLTSLQLGCMVNNVAFRQPLFTVPSPLMSEGLFPGEYRIQFEMNPNYLKRGDYNLTLKYFVNGNKRAPVQGLQLKIITSEDETGSFFTRWVTGSLRFDYAFSPLEPVEQDVTFPLR